MAHFLSMNLDITQRRKLLELARKSIELGLAARSLPGWSEAQIDADLQLEGASFATLRIDGMLRGCCGTIHPTRPLAEDVWRNAWASAFSDPRFPPLARSEYPNLDLHLSVLSPLEAVHVESELELLETLRPGTDGLVLELDAACATFLPAVWEQLPEPRAFLRHLKEKAGWPAQFWSARIRVYRYTTLSFGADEQPETDQGR
jgi:AmmeMemoRadiSam system protein A